MKYIRLTWLLGLEIGLLFILLIPGSRPARAAAFAGPQSTLTTTLTYTVYVPTVMAFQIPAACQPIAGASYESLSVVGPGRPNPDAEHDAGYNIGLLGHSAAEEHPGLVFIGGPTDPNNTPPQLYHLFGDDRTPGFSNVHHLHNGDGTPILNPAVTLAGMAVAPAEILYTPDSGYDIQYGYDALVIYASEQRIALNYTRNDNLMGYTVYIDGLCVEPSLLALYRQLDAAGRHDLPAMRGDQPLGRTWGNEILVAIRDTGSAMDPRSCKDWWQGRCPQ